MKFDEEKLGKIHQKADRFLKNKDYDFSNFSEDEVREILHELQVHQIELEMQNEELKRTQNELEESRNKYSDLFDFAPVGYFTLNENGVISEVNLTGTKILQQDRQFILNKPFTIFIQNADDKVLFFQHLNHVFEYEEQHVCRLRLKRKDGTVCYAELCSEVFGKSYNDEANQCRTIVSDITEYKKTEHKLQKSEERFMQLAENIREVFWMTKVNDAEELIYLSPSFESVWGYKPEELYRNPRLWTELIHEEERDTVRQTFEKFLEGKEDYDVEYRIVRADGSIRWIWDRGIAVEDKDGDITKVVGIAQDITEKKQALIDLEKSSQQYRRLVEKSPDIIYSFSSKRGGVYYSPRVETILGFSPSYLREHPMIWYDSIDSRDLVTVDQAVEKFLDGEPFDIEYKIKDRNGDWHWFRDRSIGKYEIGDEIIIEGIVTDITTKKKADQEILRQKAVMEAINTVFREALSCDTEEDVANTCLSVAEKLTESRFGFIAEIADDGLANTIAISDPGWEECQMPKSDAVKALKDLQIRGLWGKVIHDGESFICNTPDQHPASVGIPENHPKIKSFIGVPLKEGDEIFGVIALANKKNGYDLEDQENIEALSYSFVETLQRKRAERRLQEREQLLKTILRTVPVGIAFVKNHILKWGNESLHKILGYESRALIGKEARTFYGGTEDYERKRDEVYREIESHGFAKMESKWIRKDGASIDCLTQIQAIDVNELSKGVIVAVMDITERKLTEEKIKKLNSELENLIEELRRSNKELEQFAYIASHDLQEPLRKIRAFGNRLDTKYKDVLDERGKDYLERMQSAAERMQALINDLLTFSRITTRAKPFVPVDLRMTVAEVLSDLELLKEKLNGNVDVGELPTIDADPTQMRQLMTNLIHNALKFHRKDVPPEVEIYSEIVENIHQLDVELDEFSGEKRETPKFCKIYIKDNGIGFDEKYKERIFQLFQRLHGRSEYEGTGIGLSICKKIVDRHKGTIDAFSKVDHGATFVVILPMKQRRANEEDKDG
jgi:PAS domain S-box-containing protein